MKKEITELKNIHKGRDIWIIASGPSMNYVESSFFEGKITIGVNDVHVKFKCDYLVRKENEGMTEAYKTGIKLIVSEYNWGANDGKLNEIDGDYWFFKNLPNKLEEIDFSMVGTDKIIVSHSTITSAIHMAAYMGAKNIILCGHDCGSLDGKINFDEYQIHIHKKYKNSPYQKVEDYLNWLKTIEDQTIQVRGKLKEIYGCNIYSLNPFISLNLEGHKYEGK